MLKTLVVQKNKNMSSPFQKSFSSKSPFNTDDKLMHATQSVNDKYAIDLTGKYDEAYDKLTDAVGYVDPDVTITSSKDLASKEDETKPNEGSKMKRKTPSTMLSPLNQGGYRGGGDVDANYVPMAGVMQQFQDKVSLNVDKISDPNKYKTKSDEDSYRKLSDGTFQLIK